MINPNKRDDIGEKEILVVSFGSADQEALAEDFSGIEKAMKNAFPDFTLRRAFTSKLSIQRILQRDGVCVDDLEIALKRAIESGVKELHVVPTHLIHSEQYEDIVKLVEVHTSYFDKITISAPLLGEISDEENFTINEKIIKVIVSLTADMIERAGYDSLRTAAADGVALVLVGHGTSHTSGQIYLEMQEQIDWLGYENVFVGTIEGKPEETECYSVMREILTAGYEKVILRPLLVAVGKHAREDIAGHGEDSWLQCFEEAEVFDSVSVQAVGIGRVKAIQELYVQGT